VDADVQETIVFFRADNEVGDVGTSCSGAVQTRGPAYLGDSQSKVTSMQLNRDRTAFNNLMDEFGLDVADIPECHLVYDGFRRLCGERGLSVEAETAILYRVVAMQFAGMMKVMAGSGEEPSQKSLNNVTALLDASVDWSEAADDHIRAESIASHLNRSIETVLGDLGVRRGGAGQEPTAQRSPGPTAQRSPEPTIRNRSAEEIKREVHRCVRVAAAEKIKFRLAQINGFFDKLKNESKLRQWGIDTERQYKALVDDHPQLWNPSAPAEHRSLAVLWRNFGLGDAHSEEAIYDDRVALDVLLTWIMSLYPDVRVSSGDLSDRLRGLGLRNSRALEGAHARGHRVVMPLPIDQLVRELAEEFGPYG
jgi:hypothetical protein